MQVRIQNLEVLLHKYHNIIQDANDFQTLMEAQNLILQIKPILESLQQLQYRCASYVAIVVRRKTKIVAFSHILYYTNNRKTKKKSSNFEMSY